MVQISGKKEGILNCLTISLSSCYNIIILSRKNTIISQINIKYAKICDDLLKGLPNRTKDVICRRFGFKSGERETLEVIGSDHGITRERVRQIEKDGITRLKQNLNKYDKVFAYLREQLRNFGGLKREDLLLDLLGNSKYNNHVYFLLNLSEPFIRIGETEDLYSLWTSDNNNLAVAEKLIGHFCKKFQDTNQTIPLPDIFNVYQKEVKPIINKPLNNQALISYIEISKKIKAGSEGQLGLKDWPEITPRGVKDKAYLVFKNERKPLHFTDVASLISVRFNQEKVFSPTVHNELIKDSRFILVGRGIYALKEWGYEPGVVKDVISKVLRDAEKPMTKEEIVLEVLKQRLIKENTILLNLKDKKHFLKTEEGKYVIYKA